MNETGKKVFFWYRVYCAALALLYLLVVALGVFFAIAMPESRGHSREELFFVGIVYVVLGVVFFLVFAVAFFLPPKPFNWIVGLVMIALGMTSCLLLPATIPLLIYWIKPETKEFFGRT